MLQQVLNKLVNFSFSSFFLLDVRTGYGLETYDMLL